MFSAFDAYACMAGLKCRPSIYNFMMFDILNIVQYFSYVYIAIAIAINFTTNMIDSNLYTEIS